MSATKAVDLTRGPAQPQYILRGHTSQIHSVCFLRQNTRLLTGDADGWVVLWDVASKRARAVWRPHQAAILSLDAWGQSRIITHGRDNKLLAWQLQDSDEATFSTVLPIEDGLTPRKEPWLLHSLTVNTLNFCSFAMCASDCGVGSASDEQPVLVAVPGTKDGHIVVYSLPDETLVHSIDDAASTKAGMTMALRIMHVEGTLYVISGSENGQTSVWQHQQRSDLWQNLYTSKPHSQPILSLDVNQGLGSYYTSGADAVIARHSVFPSGTSDTKTVLTKHSGQQSLSMRSDGRIFATAGWDGRLRVYSAKSLQELAVLKWHKEGCYALAFAVVDPAPHRPHQTATEALPLPSQDKALSSGMVQRRRDTKAQTTHWLAAGAKDGKVSLWDIY